MKKAAVSINLGKMITDHIRQNKIRKTEVAACIRRSEQPITNYGQRDSLQTAIVTDLSYAL